MHQKTTATMTTTIPMVTGVKWQKKNGWRKKMRKGKITRQDFDTMMSDNDDLDLVG
jgi:hypothetical protein